MARGDGIHRTSARNVNLTAAKIGNAQRHNEREKESYTNPDIIPERTKLNIHFKEPNGGYAEMFARMEEQGLISTRGLKEDAKLYGELIFDVNSAYFYNHGGYEFARQFYGDAYKAAIEIVGREQYILSAVMHADERNRAMSEALGEDVFHYHLHVVYIPVVEKQILWTKRCKDKSLVGTVKETIMQVSSSKKWLSKPAVGEQGQPILQKNGKPVLRKSYSVLQDDFFKAMRKAGYSDLERGERGSSEEHLTVTQFKVEKEKQRLEALEKKLEAKAAALSKVEAKTKVRKELAADYMEIDSMGQSTLLGKVQFSTGEADRLKGLAKEALLSRSEIGTLNRELGEAKKEAALWKSRYERLLEQTKDFLAALRRAPELVRSFIAKVCSMEPEKKPRDKPRSPSLRQWLYR